MSERTWGHASAKPSRQVSDAPTTAPSPKFDLSELDPTLDIGLGLALQRLGGLHELERVHVLVLIEGANGAAERLEEVGELGRAVPDQIAVGVDVESERGDGRVGALQLRVGLVEGEQEAAVEDRGDAV